MVMRIRNEAELIDRLLGDDLDGAALPEPVGAPPVLVAGSPDDREVPRPALDRAAAAYGGAHDASRSPLVRSLC